MAAKVDLPSMPQFDPHADYSSLATRWDQWLKRFHIYLRAGKITDKTQQRALLLYMAGPQVQEIFETLTDTGNDEDFKTAVDKLTAYFMPKKSLEYEIYVFRKSRQAADETLDQYHTRLRKLATTCEFGDVDREIKTQIIQSCISTRLRRKALRDSTLTLNALLAEGRSIEVSENQAKGIERSLAAIHLDATSSTEIDHSLNVMRQQQQQQPYARRGSSSRKCYYCGFDYPHKNNSCPAKGKECSLCHKMNHFAKVCKSRQNQGRNKFPRQTRSPRQNNNINTVENRHSGDESNSSSEEKYVYTVKIGSETTSKARLTAKLKINRTNFPTLVDTGASINIIDEATFKHICKQKPIQLRRSKARVYAYASQSPLPMVGVFEEIVESKKKMTTAKFHVAKGNNGNLLCSETATQLGLITLNVQNVHNVNTDKPEVHTPTKAQDIPLLQTQAKADQNGNDTFIHNLTNEYHDLFSGIGCLKNFELKLHINPQVKPVAQPERRIPFHIREKVNQELDNLTKQGIIEPCTGPTPWVSPLVVTPKPKNPEEIRICVDMRLPNTAIIRERHPMPTADELIHKLNGAKVFSKLDLRHGYHQILLAPESRYITTFRTHKGLHRYVRLNYGTSAASEVFQYAISQAIAGIDGVVNISDDILIFGPTQTAHDTALKDVFERLRQVGLTLNKSKCAYNKGTLEFFGMIFSADGVSPDPKKIAAITNAPRPTTVSGVRSLLGMTNYCSKFIMNYASITTPLRQLTKKNARFQWLPAHESAWKTLTRALTSAPVMAYFDTNKCTELIVDASPTGLGAILQQHTPDKQDHKVIAYASRALSPVEQRYSQTEREALAIVWAMERLHIYLYGTEFVLYTDHKPLELICNNPKSKPPARIERWFLRLQKYIFRVQYRPGKDNPSDYMSRHPLPTPATRNSNAAEEYINFIAQHTTPKAISLEEIKQQTKEDATLQTAIQYTRNGRWHEAKNLTDPNINKKELDILYSIRTELTASKDDDLLLKATRIIIPTSLRKRAINLAHEGHQGLTKTKQLLREKIWFPSIDSSVKKIVDACIPCQSTTPAHPPVPLKMSKMPPTPWHTVHIDFLGPLPTGELLLVAIDAYSRYPEVDIVHSTGAATLIPKLDKIFSTHGIPYRVVSDNGPPFNGNEIRRYMEIHGIEYSTITPLWPQGNSEAESFMKPLLKSILTARTEGRKWKKELYTFLLNYRATPHSTTKVAPAELLFNRPIRTKIPQQVTSSKPINKHIMAKENDQQSKAQMKQYADQRRHTKKMQVNVGDLVICKQPKKNKFSTKFNPAPYKVIKVNGSTITAQRHTHQITRNISYFKRLNLDDDERQHHLDDQTSDDEGDEIIRNGQNEQNEVARRYPVRERQQTNFYHDPNSAILTH